MFKNVLNVLDNYINFWHEIIALGLNPLTNRVDYILEYQQAEFTLEYLYLVHTILKPHISNLNTNLYKSYFLLQMIQCFGILIDEIYDQVFKPITQRLNTLYCIS